MWLKVHQFKLYCSQKWHLQFFVLLILVMTDKSEIFLKFCLNIHRFLLFLLSECSLDHIIGPNYLIERFPCITVLHLGILNSAFLSSYLFVGLLNKSRRGFRAKLFLTLYMRTAISCNLLLYRVERFDFSSSDLQLLCLYTALKARSWTLLSFLRSDVLHKWNTSPPVRNMLCVVELLFCRTLV